MALKVTEFTLDKVSKSLVCKLPAPELSLAGARIKPIENQDVFGFVFEVIYLELHPEIKINIPGIKFDNSDIYGKIKIEKGWELFENGEIKEFEIEEVQNLNLPPRKETSSKKGIRFSFRNVSGLQFSSFYLDIRGGETGGAGRNEHGDPHAHLIERNTQKDLGKLFFCAVDNWNPAGSKIKFDGSDISKKMKKEIISWLKSNNLKNLKYLNDTWEVLNLFNDRITSPTNQ